MVVYRRSPYLHRNYYYSDSRQPQEKKTQQTSLKKDSLKNTVEEQNSQTIKTIEDIPMPNEKETATETVFNKTDNYGINPEAHFTSGFRSDNFNTEQRKSKFSLTSILPKQLNFEDLIILGIIFILIHEGRKDDMLLVALIYLLI